MAGCLYRESPPLPSHPSAGFGGMLIEDAVLKPAVFLLLPHCAYPTELGISSLGKHSVSASFCKAQGTQLHGDRAASKKKKKA